MVDNWNKVVKPQDKVYHLGDFCFNERVLTKFAPRLKGRKFLVMGNHDTCPTNVYLKYFEQLHAALPFNKLGIICTHIPVHSSQLEYRFKRNFHGHLHTEVVKNPYTGAKDHRYVNVSVEQINFQPVSLENLI